jgi:hypothetical protein
MRSALALFSIIALAVASAACTGQETLATAPEPAPAALAAGSVSSAARGGRPASTGVVFVTSQGLYYDTFVAVDPLPMQGRFQLLVNGQTEFGPGQPGYLGGRWWEDVNGNGEQDSGDHFFLCPLLPPGRTTP